MFCGEVYGVLSSLAIILLGKRESCLLYCNCVVTVIFLCKFVTVPKAGLRSMKVTFLGHSQLPFVIHVYQVEHTDNLNAKHHACISITPVGLRGTFRTRKANS